MTVSQSTLESLKALAAELNEASDDLNSILDQHNKDLSSTGLNLTAWTCVTLDCSNPYRDEDYEQNVIEYQELGFCKLGAVYGIAVRHVICGEGSRNCADATPCWDDILCTDSPTSILNAPRHVRLEAIDHLDRVAVTLKEQAERYIKNIKKAKAAVSPNIPGGAKQMTTEEVFWAGAENARRNLKHLQPKKNA